VCLFLLLVLYGISLFYCVIRFAITSDSTGSYLAAIDNDNEGYIYTSADYGVTWISRTTAGGRQWYVNYYYMVIVSSSVYLYPFVLFLRRGIASDSTGRYLAAADFNCCSGGGYIYTSSDYGVSWTSRTDAGTQYWYVNYCTNIDILYCVFIVLYFVSLFSKVEDYK